MAREVLETGYYRHFKGGVYLVTGMRFDTTTNREVVEYESTNGTKQKYTRAVSDFLGTIMIEGRTLVNKFQYIGNNPPQSVNLSKINEQSKGTKIYD